MSYPNIRIATRRSQLALWQAEYVQAQLRHHFPGIEVELVPMQTKGDKLLDSPLAKLGGKGLFIKELEIAMLEGEADIAVHSMKDVPAELPDEFGIYAICPRENPSDAFVSNNFASLDDLPKGSRVGTSSLRRQCQLKALRPDLVFEDLRGNVNTRLRKLDEGQYDAIILASAGLIRLGMEDRIAEAIDCTKIIPAVGQGAVGIECRHDNAEVIKLLKTLADEDSTTRVLAERAMNNRLQGGCQVPIAGFATLDGESLSMTGLVGAVDGSKVISVGKLAHRDDAESLGVEVAEALLQQGAGEILSALSE